MFGFGMVFNRNTQGHRYRVLNTLERLKVLKDDVAKLKRKNKKDEELQATITLVEKAVDDDIAILQSGEFTIKQEKEMQEYIKKTRNSFAYYELSKKFGTAA